MSAIYGYDVGLAISGIAARGRNCGDSAADAPDLGCQVWQVELQTTAHAHRIDNQTSLSSVFRNQISQIRSGSVAIAESKSSQNYKLACEHN